MVSERLTTRTDKHAHELINMANTMIAQIHEMKGFRASLINKRKAKIFEMDKAIKKVEASSESEIHKVDKDIYRIVNSIKTMIGAKDFIILSKKFDKSMGKTKDLNSSSSLIKTNDETKQNNISVQKPEDQM